MVSDDQAPTSLWRWWLQPLESVQEKSSPPLDIAQLEITIDSVSSSTEAKFRKMILETAKTALSSARQTLVSQFETHNDGAVYVGRHAWLMWQARIAALPEETAPPGQEPDPADQAEEQLHARNMRGTQTGLCQPFLQRIERRIDSGGAVERAARGVLLQCLALAEPLAAAALLKAWATRSAHLARIVGPPSTVSSAFGCSILALIRPVAGLSAEAKLVACIAWRIRLL